MEEQIPLSDAATKVLDRMRSLASGGVVQTRHLLEALLTEAESETLTILQRIGATNAMLNDALGQVQAAEAEGDAGQSTALAEVLQLAQKETRSTLKEALGTNQLVLALLREQTGVAGKILREAGVTPRKFYDTIGHLELERREQQPKAYKSYKEMRRQSIEWRFVQGRFKQVNIFRQISPVFFIMVGVLIMFAASLYFDLLPAGPVAFLFVLLGWIISVALHEFGHALVGYLGGDDSIIDKGYLTLNPGLYANLLTSVVFPIIFILIGGIPLPGGAVYIDRSRLRDYRWGSLVSLAGPLMNVLFTIFLLLPFWFGITASQFGTQTEFWSAWAMLAYFQVLAFCLNMLPIPALDGYGIIETFLPTRLQLQLYPVKRFGLWIVLILFIWIDPIANLFFGLTFFLSTLVGIDPIFIGEGFRLFFFWRGL